MSSDLDRLQGTWHVIAVETGGENPPIGDAQVVVKDRTFTSLGMGLPFAGTIDLDEQARPKHLDMVFTAGHATGVRHPGIYKIDGEKWTLCLNTQGSTRPTAFRADAVGVVLETLARKKPARKAGGAARAAVSPQPAPPPLTTLGNEGGPVSLIDGEWAMVSAVLNGAPLAPDMVKWCRRVTRGGVTAVIAGPQVMLKATFTLDTTATPHRIDYVNLEGTMKGKAQQGIFELNGDSLRICVAAPGAPRPASFESVKGDGRSCTAWRKQPL